MNKLLTLAYLLTAFSAKADYWTQKADFGGAPRFGAVGFSIGNKGYVGTGASSYISTICYNDFWEYNSSSNVWTQKANFGGIARNGASAFCINNKGYIGCGLTANGSLLWDFWEYDPLTNSWSQKAYVGNMQRYLAVGFSIGGKGYIGTGTEMAELC